MWRATNLEKIAENGDTGGTRQGDGMGSTPEHAVEKPQDAADQLATSLEPAQEEGSEDNSSDGIDNAKIADAIDQL